MHHQTRDKPTGRDSRKLKINDIMTATITMTKDAKKRGTYKNTYLDIRKSKAQILVIGLSNRYELFCRNIELKEGRSVKKLNDNIYSVTDREYERLSKIYHIEFDL